LKGSDRGSDPQRAARRDERARARQALAERYKREQDALRAQRPALRQSLAARHRAERQQLSIELRHERAAGIAENKALGLGPQNAISQWAYEAAKRREALQKRQAAERHELTQKIPRTQVWHTWLEQQAQAGDEAARTALRGIRYREQRGKNKSQDGIEGEELDPLRRLTVAALQAEIDHRRQCVIYRGLDGREKFTDIGPRLVMHDKSADSLEAALRIAAQKFGGKVDITGSSEFRERAARQAVRLGIEVANADLAAVVADEQAKVQQTRGTWLVPRQAQSVMQQCDTPRRQNLAQPAPAQDEALMAGVRERVATFIAEAGQRTASNAWQPGPGQAPSQSRDPIDSADLAGESILAHLSSQGWDALELAGQGQALAPGQQALLCNGEQPDLVNAQGQLTPLGQAAYARQQDRLAQERKVLQKLTEERRRSRPSPAAAPPPAADTSKTAMPQAQDQAPKQAEPVKSVPFLPMLDLSPLPQQDSEHGQEPGVPRRSQPRSSRGHGRGGHGR